MKINPPIQLHHEGVNLSEVSKGILLPSFISIIVGKPGSGKTHLLQQLILDERFYANKFDYVFFFSPSRQDGNLEFDQENHSAVIVPQIVHSLVDQFNSQLPDGHLLLIFDDVVNQLYQQRYQQVWHTLFYNRRHLIKSGSVSIIVTSQKYTDIPTYIRAATDSMFLFKVSHHQLDKVCKQVPLSMKPKDLKAKVNELGKHQFIYACYSDDKVYNNEFKLL